MRMEGNNGIEQRRSDDLLLVRTTFMFVVDFGRMVSTSSMSALDRRNIAAINRNRVREPTTLHVSEIFCHAGGSMYVRHMLVCRL